MKPCGHKDGWVSCEEIVISENMTNDGIIATFICNTLNCHQKKRFKLDITNIEEVK